MPIVICPACQERVEKDLLFEHLSECQGIIKVNQNNNHKKGEEKDRSDKGGDETGEA